MDPLPRSLSLDLEVGKNDQRIHALAGVRPDTDVSFTYIHRRGGLPEALSRLDDLADGADFVLGHNLIDFDLPHLRAANPQLRLLQLPAVDTLRLNPLAFPRNPLPPSGQALPGRGAQEGKDQRSGAGCSPCSAGLP